MQIIHTTSVKLSALLLQVAARVTWIGFFRASQEKLNSSYMSNFSPTALEQLCIRHQLQLFLRLWWLPFLQGSLCNITIYNVTLLSLVSHSACPDLREAIQHTVFYTMCFMLYKLSWHATALIDCTRVLTEYCITLTSCTAYLPALHGRHSNNGQHVFVDNSRQLQHL